MSIYDKIAKKLKNTSPAQIIDAPKRAIYAKISEKLGIKPSGDSEQTAIDMVQAAADKLGLPKDSLLADIGKTAAVTGLEALTPDATLALGPAGRVVGKGIKAATRGTKLADIAASAAAKSKEGIAKAVDKATEMGVLKNELKPAEQVLNYKDMRKSMRKPMTSPDSDALAKELNDKVAKVPEHTQPNVDHDVISRLLRKERQERVFDYKKKK